MSAHLEALVEDFADVSLLQGSKVGFTPTNYTELLTLFKTTRFIGHNDPPAESIEARTAVGKNIFDVARSGTVQFAMPFNSHNGCAKTETYLEENTDPQSVSNGSKRSPVIITKDGDTLGIIKTLGDPTCYGLKTDLEAGIIEGVISSPTPQSLIMWDHFVKQRSKAEHAWTVPAESFQAFNPLRYGILLVPVEERGFLPAYYDIDASGIRHTQHEDIKARTDSFLPTALPPPVKLTVEV